jgi:predicted DCC family thiol-disulfide oxidoreductase YuxK
VHTEMSDNYDRRRVRGWILYDAECLLCLALLQRFRLQIETAGLLAEPLQSDWIRARLKMPEDHLLDEMKLLLPSGEVFGGADAFVRLARAIPAAARPWWAWGIVGLSKFPFAKILGRAVYRRVAARRYCKSGKCLIPATSKGVETCIR